MADEHVDLSQAVSPAFIAGLTEGSRPVEPLSPAEIQAVHDDIQKVIRASGDYASRHYRDDGSDRLAQLKLAPQYLDKDGKVMPERTLGTSTVSDIFIGFTRDDPEGFPLVSEVRKGGNPWGDILNPAGIVITKQEVRDVLFVEPDKVEGEDATFTVSVAETRIVEPAAKHPVDPGRFRDLMTRIRGGEVIAKDKPNMPIAKILSQASAPEPPAAPTVAPAPVV